MSTILSANLDELKGLKKNKYKQAVILYIALHSHFNKIQVVQYIIRSLAEKISSKFTNYTVGNLDLTMLQEKVNLLTTKNKENLHKKKQKSLLMHFNSIFSQRNSDCHLKEETFEVKEDVRTVLADLGLTEYYPQKITYEDVIKVRENDFKKFDEIPTYLDELPWYFMKQLLRLNGTIRETCSGERRKGENEPNFDWPDCEEETDCRSKQDDSKETAQNIEGSLPHPLDLIYAVFLCADEFLQQVLVDKMLRCQYAAPFILPSAKMRWDESQNIVLYRGYQAIFRSYCGEDNQLITKNLAKLDCPLVSCLSFKGDS